MRPERARLESIVASALNSISRQSPARNRSLSVELRRLIAATPFGKEVRGAGTVGAGVIVVITRGANYDEIISAAHAAHATCRLMDRFWFQMM